MIKKSLIIVLMLSVGSVMGQNMNNKFKVHIKGITFNMVRVEPGSYRIPADSTGGILTKKVNEEFYIGEYEVTQELWEAVMGNNPSKIKGRNHPVENISYDDIRKFIEKLNNEHSMRFSGLTFRLPSETEWIYAATGGNQNSEILKYSGSNDPSSIGWFNDPNNTHHPVGLLRPNALGLYDMSGNVTELVEANVQGKSVFKGGSFYSLADDTDENSKLYGRIEVSGHGKKGPVLGFRLVMNPPPAVKIRVSNNLLEYEKNGSDDWKTITVQINRDHYGVKCDEKWIDLDTSSYGRIKIWCKSNNNSFERSAKIIVSCDTVEEFINVRQRAQDLQFDVTPRERKEIPCDEYSCTFTIVSNGKTYEVSDLPQWMTIKEKGTNVLTITCSPNPSEDKERVDSFYVSATADRQSKSICVRVEQKKRESLKLIVGKGDERRKVDSIYFSSISFRRKNFVYGVDYNYVGTHGIIADKISDTGSFKLYLNRDRKNGAPREIHLDIKRNGTSDRRILKAQLRTDSSTRVVPITIVQDTSQVPRTFLNPMFGYDFKNSDYLVGLSLSAVPRKTNINNRFGFRLSAYYKIEEVAGALNLGINVRATKRRSPVGVHIFAAAGPSVDFDDKVAGPVVDLGVRLSWNQFKCPHWSWWDLTFGCVYMCGSFIPTVGLGFGPGLIAGGATGLGFLIKSLVD